MALPQEFEVYGAAPANNLARRSTKFMRIAIVAGAVVLSMLAAVAFLAKDTEEASRVEDFAVTPEDKLKNMVVNMAEHADTVSVPDMVAKLAEWRNNPNTILDLPEEARTQVQSIPEVLPLALLMFAFSDAGGHGFKHNDAHSACG